MEGRRPLYSHRQPEGFFEAASEAVSRHAAAVANTTMLKLLKTVEYCMPDIRRRAAMARFTF